MRSVRRAFGEETLSDGEMRARADVLELDRTLAVFDGKEVVGTAGIFSFQITVPDQESNACAGVTRVTVRTTHRRKGLLSAMMRRQLDDIHTRGEPLAALYASEAAIYGRFGYGIATYQARLELDSARTSFRRHASTAGRVVSVEAAEAVPIFTAVWDRARRTQAGMLTMDERWWRFILADPPGERDGGSPQYLVVSEGHQGAEGFARYRIKMRWNASNEPDGEVRVSFLVATTAEAYASLWRYLLSIDLISKVSTEMRPPDEPLRFLLANSRQPKMSLEDGLWLRLVDVEQALRGRRYPTAGRLVIRVHDRFCPWNDGTLELDGGPDGAECRRSAGEPDLELDVADLAALYLGGNHAGVLHAAGRIIEHRPGAVSRATRMFAGERVPWCPTHF